jgi:hypothetical protein
MMYLFPLIPAKAGIQLKENGATRAHIAWQKLGPRFRGDER